MAYAVSSSAPNGFEHSMFSSVDSGHDASEKFFDDWNEKVKATVPSERLLIFEAKEGWGPLCSFLEVPVPDTPFPR